MIVGLKYVGASDDDIPTRVPVGDVVSLQREPFDLRHSNGIAAYYDGRKVGYLSPEKHALWDSLGSSARHQAKVIGEILDEDGDLAGLDIEIVGPTARRKQSAPMKPEISENVLGRGKILRTTLGVGALLLTVLVSPSSTGIDNRILAVKRITANVLLREDRSTAMNEPEMQESQQLSEDLQRTRPGPAHRQILFQEFQRQSRETATHRQAANHELASEIAERRRNIEEMMLVRQHQREAERKQLTLNKMNQGELARQENRMAAWALAHQAQQAKEAENTRHAVPEKRNAEAKAALALPIDNPRKVRKKANFSRYAREN